MSTQPQGEKKPEVSRIEINRDLCISAASCAALAPGTFALDDEGKVKLIDSSGDGVERVVEAARSCPVDAIRLYDERGKRLWPPTRQTKHG